MNLSPDPIRDVFRKHGIRCTRQRELIYSTLVVTRVHPTAEELLRLIQHRDSALSLATVYNTLDVFLERGLCRKIGSSVASGPCRYDAEVHDHAHAILPSGQILDLPEDLGRRVVASLTPELRSEIEARLGCKVARVAFELVLARANGEASTDGEHAI